MVLKAVWDFCRYLFWQIWGEQKAEGIMWR